MVSRGRGVEFWPAITIVIVIFIRHELDLDGPVSASSNGPFKGLPSRLGTFAYVTNVKCKSLCLCENLIINFGNFF